MPLSQDEKDIRKVWKLSKQRLKRAKMTEEQKKFKNQREQQYRFKKRMQILARQQDEIKVINYLQSTNVS